MSGALVAGTFWATQNFQTPPDSNRSKARKPASFVSLSEHLLRTAKVVSVGPSLGLQLTHFEVPAATGKSIGLCQIYPRIELTFVADDMAVNGTPPALSIEGPCHPSADGQTLEPISVEFDQILHAAVKNQKFQNFLNQEVSATVQNVSDTWPKIWVLHQIRLFDSDGPTSKPVTIEFEEIRETLNENIYLKTR